MNTSNYIRIECPKCHRNAIYDVGSRSAFCGHCKYEYDEYSYNTINIIPIIISLLIIAVLISSCMFQRSYIDTDTQTLMDTSRIHYKGNLK